MFIRGNRDLDSNIKEVDKNTFNYTSKIPVL